MDLKLVCYSFKIAFVLVPENLKKSYSFIIAGNF